ncbi:NTP transferase domain-containing protein [uncultured Paludibaculum sp.]|uniref:NTP transferase domain-containing protein n=1 Tax=uncultured Paludibaculum sp. TaxID=1765020 RepID=UPI002AAB6C45|nr:NTP transferase domain-containing protein [uncultured Paludibaculum sp.]
MKVCAVIPAAGRGTRLGVDVPKILVPMVPGCTIWDVLKRKLWAVVDHIHVVLSPSGLPQFEAILGSDADRASVSTGVQETPTGMGDAVFSGVPVWEKADDLLVIWSDQVHVSAQTLGDCLRAHAAGNKPRLTLPVVSMPEPYVEYRFDDRGCLLRVLQSREGDQCAPGGYGDVGVFLLSTAGLPRLWDEYCAITQPGTATGERNFLPFLVYLSSQGWEVGRVAVTDPNEARGINTPEDLAFFQSLYSGEGAPPR